jgi:hypothetical protein
MYNELVLVIKYDKVDDEDRKHARLLLSQLNTASGRHLMRKEITYFLEDMDEKYGDIHKRTLEQELTDLKSDYEEYKKKPIKGMYKLDGIQYTNANDKICADYELRIMNLEKQIKNYK